MAQIERTHYDGSFAVGASLGASDVVNLTGMSMLALRSTTALVLTMYSARSATGTYTACKDQYGAEITVTLTNDNKWTNVNPQSFPYRFVKFVAASGTATVEHVAKG